MNTRRNSAVGVEGLRLGPKFALLSRAWDALLVHINFCVCILSASSGLIR
jgi:hypothetical protein